MYDTISKKTTNKSVYNKTEDFATNYEYSMLALCYQYQDKLTELFNDVDDTYFIVEINKIIFVALNNLYTNPKVNKIDLSTLLQECKNLGASSLAPDAYYMGLSTQDVSGINYENNLEHLRNATKKKKLYEFLSKKAQETYNNKSDKLDNYTGDELVDQCLADLSTLQVDQDRDSDKTINMAEASKDFYEEAMNRTGELLGLETGFPALDATIQGLRPQHLIIFAGPPKGGKSSLMLNITRHVLQKHKVPVLYLSTEMGPKEDFFRLLAQVSEVEERDILSKKHLNNPKQLDKVNKALKEIDSYQFHHEYLTEFNSKIIINKITRAKAKYKIELAVFDYIKMETVNSENNSRIKDLREDQILGDITNALKSVAGKLDIPIITGCQINSRTDNIADSDRLIRYCNTLIRFDPKKFNWEDCDLEDVRRYGTHWLTIKESRSGGSFKKIPIMFYKPILKTVQAEIKPDDEESVEDIKHKINSLMPGSDQQKEFITNNILTKTPRNLEENSLAESESFLEDEDDPLF